MDYADRIQALAEELTGKACRAFLNQDMDFAIFRDSIENIFEAISSDCADPEGWLDLVATTVQYTKVCPVCRRKFTPKSSDQVYCTFSCQEA